MRIDSDDHPAQLSHTTLPNSHTCTYTSTHGTHITTGTTILTWETRHSSAMRLLTLPATMRSSISGFFLSSTVCSLWSEVQSGAVHARGSASISSAQKQVHKQAREYHPAHAAGQDKRMTALFHDKGYSNLLVAKHATIHTTELAVTVT